MKRLLSHADILVYKDGNWTALRDAYLGIDGDTIHYLSEIRPTEAYEEEKNLRGKLLMPGLINCHCHAPMVFLRGIGSDRNLQDWLFNYIFPTEARWTDRGIHAATELSILELLASGVTSFSDMYYRIDQMVDVVSASGMKANLCRATQGRPGLPFDQNTDCREGIEIFDRFQNCCSGRIRIDLCIHAEYTNTPETIEAYSEVCRQKGAGMHIHLSETRKEHEECLAKYGMTPTALFEKLGTFRNRTTAAHSVWVTDDDLEIIRRNGVNPVHCPTSNMKLGSGFAPVQKMLNMGINVTLGTDGASSNNNLNMFEEMHLAAILHKGRQLDPTLVTPSQVLKMSTINGAKLQGRPDTGELKPGMKADLIAVDFDKPHLIPAFDYPAMLCYSAQSSDVCMTMVDGNILYENGEYRTLDADRIRYEARQLVRELYD